MKKQDQIVIRHPELGESVIMKSSLKVWELKGWTAVSSQNVEETSEEVAGEDHNLMFDFNQDNEPSEASEKE